MKAVAVYPDSRSVRVIDAPDPQLKGPGCVKLRILEVGVCGTDREISRFEYGQPPAGNDHLIIGHESLGEVVETGPQVSDLKAGDLAVLMVRRPCQQAACVACRAGRQDFCYTGRYTERGIKGRHGYMAEMAADEHQYAVGVPPELRDVAVLTEPLTIAEKAIEEVGRIQQRLPWGLPGRDGRPTYRHKAVVVGAGPVGLLGAMALAVRPFEVHVYSREPADDPRAGIAKAIGAVYHCSREVQMDDLAGELGNIDLVYEATGAAQVSFDMLAQLGVNAVFILTGVPGENNPIRLDGGGLMRNMVLRNQVLLGSVNAPRKAYESAVADLVTFMRNWPEAVRGVITDRHPIDEAPGVLTGKGEGIKTVIRPGG